MKDYDYLYAFEDFTDEVSNVQVTNCSTEQRYRVGVNVDDHEFVTRRYHHVPSYLADGIDLAVAVAVADRLSVRKDRTCRMHLSLPVRHPSVLSHPAIIKQLQQILYWYTHDRWSFEFTTRRHHGRYVELNTCHPFLRDSVSPDVALWSGGLDSFAGLYSLLDSDGSQTYVLCGTGMNTQIAHKQETTAHLLAQRFPGRTNLVRIPYRLEGIGDMQRHTLQRSRGFVFLLLGAICALLEGQSRLSIYENGIGAINLPFSDAEVGLDHSVSVHPLSLLQMSSFVSLLFQTPFSFVNPFLFQTKAQMCQPLRADPLCQALIGATFTCDRPHREYPLQCGYCSSCLLRRQALCAADIVDPTSYIVTDKVIGGREAPLSYGDYLRAMLGQLDTFRTCFMGEDPWRCLSASYPSLQEIVDEMDERQEMARPPIVERLLSLYETYTHEWEKETISSQLNVGWLLGMRQ